MTAPADIEPTLAEVLERVSAELIVSPKTELKAVAKETGCSVNHLNDGTGPIRQRALRGAARMNARKALRARNGERFRVTAIIERFGHKNGWAGAVRTVLLRDLRDAATGAELTDHLWFTAGVWTRDLREGDRIAFTARATKYAKGYFGRRAVFDAPPSLDWRLERPTAVEKLIAAAK